MTQGVPESFMSPDNWIIKMLGFLIVTIVSGHVVTKVIHLVKGTRQSTKTLINALEWLFVVVAVVIVCKSYLTGELRDGGNLSHGLACIGVFFVATIASMLVVILVGKLNPH